MEQTSNKKWIKIVCIVLACLLVVGLAIGAFVFFNSNYYRFRMSAFEGEYFNRVSHLDERPEDSIRFVLSMTDNGENIQINRLVGCRVDGENVEFVNYKGNYKYDVIDESAFDPTVAETVKRYAQIFAGSCNVYKDRIEFLQSGVTMPITYNEYKCKADDGTDIMPQRSISIKDTETGTVFSGYMETWHIWKNSVHAWPKYFEMFANIDLKVSDTRVYHVMVATGYFNTKEYNEFFNKGEK